MPVHLTFTLDKVFLRAGTVSHTFSAAGQVRPARPWDRLTQFGVLAFWPKSVGWLRLSASATPEPATAGPTIAFHQTIPLARQVYAIPHEWTEKLGIRRYGFHGASHRYISWRVPELVGREKAKRQCAGHNKFSHLTASFLILFGSCKSPVGNARVAGRVPGLRSFRAGVPAPAGFAVWRRGRPPSRSSRARPKPTTKISAKEIPPTPR